MGVGSKVEEALCPSSALPWPVAVGPGWVLAFGGVCVGTLELSIHTGIVCRSWARAPGPSAVRVIPQSGSHCFLKVSVSKPSAHQTREKQPKRENSEDVGKLVRWAQQLRETVWRTVQQTVSGLGEQGRSRGGPREGAPRGGGCALTVAFGGVGMSPETGSVLWE